MGRGDLTDEQWAALEPLSPRGARAGRPPVRPRRRLIDGNRRKRHRAVATRYDRLAVRYEAAVLVAAVDERLWPSCACRPRNT
ncbi:hypothetical protein ACIQJ4_32295 [Streptomyces filamentosus]|uniref:hypothetical protein n=1 Tax=Streptomyces filamentosus TaxID=67294 RepID=UPI00382892E2